MKPGLSKSRIINWRQCPKRLWLETHRPDLLEVSAQTERAYQVGHEIGSVARQLFPSGILIEGSDMRDALRRTKEQVFANRRVPLFEATFERDGVLVKTDLLLPDSDGYRLVEVKAATSVKDYYLEDVAIQRWVLVDSVRLTSVELAHVDNTFTYPGGGNYQGLFRHVPLHSETEALSRVVPTWVDGARKTLAGGKPSIETGDQCANPFECPFLAYCNAGKSRVDFPVESLPYLSQNKYQLLQAQGIMDIRQVPPDFPLSETQERVRRVTIDAKPELLPGAACILSDLPYPRYYLDFETVSMAVPIWPGTHPYQKVPVQWSCHVEREPGRLEHRSFLADGLRDPRAAFAASLLEAVESDGPIFVYNQAFEVGRIRELADDLPHLAPNLTAIAERVVDLLPIARESYYHPAMQGSWSIKSILPTIKTDISYDGMEVADGGAADEAWQEILNPRTPTGRRDCLRKSLAEYCALDTMAMVQLAWFLVGNFAESTKSPETSVTPAIKQAN